MFTFPRNRCLFLMMALRYVPVLTSSWCATNYVMNFIHLRRKIHETYLHQYRTYLKHLLVDSQLTIAVRVIALIVRRDGFGSWRDPCSSLHNIETAIWFPLEVAHLGLPGCCCHSCVSCRASTFASGNKSSAQPSNCSSIGVINTSRMCTTNNFSGHESTLFDPKHLGAATTLVLRLDRSFILLLHHFDSSIYYSPSTTQP